MKRIDKEELLLWVVDYKYNESDKGIGTCEAYIAVRDEAERAKYTFDNMSRNEKKELMCALIDKVGYPCEDYADDFEEDFSPFGFTCSWDEAKAAIHFAATFRV